MNGRTLETLKTETEGDGLDVRSGGH